MSGNTNPGNFANRPTEEVKEIASKVSQALSISQSKTIKHKITQTNRAAKHPTAAQAATPAPAPALQAEAARRSPPRAVTSRVNSQRGARLLRRLGLRVVLTLRLREDDGMHG